MKIMKNNKILLYLLYLLILNSTIYILEGCIIQNPDDSNDDESAIISSSSLSSAYSSSSISSSAVSSSSSVSSDHIWTEYNKTGVIGTDKPSYRYNLAMAYAGGTKIILFGGFSGIGGEQCDTWEYDDSTHIWTQYNTGGTEGIDKPHKRSAHAMAYAGDSKVILFGGDAPSFNGGDTWEYDLSNHTWTQYNTGGTAGVDRPYYRYGLAMSYIGGSKLILFSGSNDNDTWEYDASNHTWTEYNTGGVDGVDKPESRMWHSMAYVGDNKLILFGGYSTTEKFGDKWEYNALTHTWTEYNTAGTAGVDKPLPRFGHAATYIGGSKLILFGGYNDAFLYFKDTWEYDVSTHLWTELNTTGTAGTDKPYSRYWFSMAYAGGAKSILFGGWDGGYRYDTWEYFLQ